LTTGFARTGYELETMETRDQRNKYTAEKKAEEEEKKHKE
jgi:hypothetical protein